MARLFGFIFGLVVVVGFASVSANVAIYSVTFVPCVPGSTCPQGNPLFFNQTFALNGALSPNLILSVGDRLEFDLVTSVPIHPLTICQNSPLPNFCRGANTSDQLKTPITQAGTNISVTFTTAGTYYYGCFNHPGMGARIDVIQTTTTSLSTSTVTTSSSTSTVTTSVGHQLSASFLLIIGIFLLAIMVI